MMKARRHPVIRHDNLAIPVVFSIPRGLRSWVDENGSAKIIEAVQKAVIYSLDHPDTKMRILTSDEVKRRINICLNYLQISYHGIEGISMTQLCDCMPGVLVETLKAGKQVQDSLSNIEAGAMWAPTLAQDRAPLMAELDEELDPSHPGGEAIELEQRAEELAKQVPEFQGDSDGEEDEE